MTTEREVRLRLFTLADVAAHHAGEDAQSVRWLTEGHESTVESTTRWIRGHLDAHRRRQGEIVFAVELDEQLAGMVSANLDHDQVGLAPGEVNISYAVHPWARRQGVATAAVEAMCRHLSAEHLAVRAIIRADPRNEASARTALACRFVPTGLHPTASGDVLAFYRRDL